MASRNSPEILIVGGGLAGLATALKCVDFADVTVLYKTRREATASRSAQGGIAAVQSKDDSFSEHIEDTIQAGYGLCHEDIVRLCVEDGPKRLEELRDWGIDFDLSLHREGGHRHSRIAHVADHTGRSVMDALQKRVQADSRIRVLENRMAIDVIADGSGVRGLYVLNKETAQVDAIPASAVILATGGAGKVYLYTSNPPEASGDGLAIALRAGCLLANMEFFQFHPTLFYHSQVNSMLITEALRGAGAVLLNRKHERFTDEMKPRDQVARAIDEEMKRSGAKHVWLDCRAVDSIEARFPSIVATCRQVGVDPAITPIPVVPGAHYSCGGVVVDRDGHTHVRGLYAVGEIAMTGLHGANRLASNSLLEALVFAHRTAASVRQSFLDQKKTEATLPPWDFGSARPVGEEIWINHLWYEVRHTMWNFVGIVRNDFRLQKALNRLRMIASDVHELYWSTRPTATLLELRNICLVALSICEAAERRKESRGLHYNQDHLATDAAFVGELHGRLDPVGALHWSWTGGPFSS